MFFIHLNFLKGEIVKKQLLKAVGLSIAASIFITGCASWKLDKPLEPRAKKDVVVLNDAPKVNKLFTEENIINENVDIPNPYTVSADDIVVEEAHAKDRPPRELMVDVAPAEFYNKKLGDIIKVLTADMGNVGVVYEPNVDPGIVVNMKTPNGKLYNILQTIAEQVGYNLYYDSSKAVIRVSQFKTMNYYIPAGIFIDRQVNVSLGNASGGSGGASGSINLNAENPSEALKKALESMGSQDKIVTFDKDTGLLMVKEHAIYIPEITRFVYDFVADRNRKFIVEMAIVDVTLSSNRDRTLDAGAAIDGLAKSIQSVTAGGASVNFLSGGSGIQISANTGADAVKKSVSINGVINLLNQFTEANVVEQAKSVVANHSVKYIANLTNKRIPVSCEKEETDSTGNSKSTYSTKSETFKDGIQYVARIDAYKRKKDIIDVSSAPSINTVDRGEGVAPGNKDGCSVIYPTVSTKVREMLSTATIRSGDIIVTGGLIREDDAYSAKTNPLTEDLTPLGAKNMQKNKIETVFIVKVTELTNPNQTFEIPALTRQLAEDKLKGMGSKER